jgi:hypothetical protein
VANPFLYRDPLGRVREMLSFRQQEMYGQGLLSENEAVPGGLNIRLPLLFDRSLGELGTLSKRSGAPLDLPLVALGVVALGVRVVQGRSAARFLGTEGMVLMLCATVVLGVGANLGLDWARYYMPVLTLTPVLLGVGAVTLLRWLGILTRVT